MAFPLLFGGRKKEDLDLSRATYRAHMTATNPAELQRLDHVWRDRAQASRLLWQRHFTLGRFRRLLWQLSGRRLKDWDEVHTQFPLPLGYLPSIEMESEDIRLTFALDNIAYVVTKRNGSRPLQLEIGRLECEVQQLEAERQRLEEVAAHIPKKST